MKGCGKRFSLFNRRHHCRQCGWLICWKCVGYAPVKTANAVGMNGYRRVIVCAQCYYEIVERFESGVLFPPPVMIQTFNVQSALVGASQLASPPPTPTNDTAGDAEEIAEHQPASPTAAKRRFRVEDSSLRVVFTVPGTGAPDYKQTKELFRPPENGALKRTKIPQQESECKASGKVYVLKEGKKGKDQLRWALLTKEMFLQFYEAEFVSGGCFF